MGSQTNDKFSVYYNVDTNKLIPDGFPSIEVAWLLAPYQS